MSQTNAFCDTTAKPDGRRDDVNVMSHGLHGIPMHSHLKPPSHSEPHGHPVGQSPVETATPPSKNAYFTGTNFTVDPDFQIC